MPAVLDIKIDGAGTRKELADALRMVADNLHSIDKIEEIYNINGAEYNGNTLSVILTDREQD